MEAAEWSASTATLVMEEEEEDDMQTHALSVGEGEDPEEEEDDQEWAQRRSGHGKSLQTLLREMDVGTLRAAADAQEEEGDDEDEEEEEDDRAALRAELRHAEERVRVLEARLLDAEETIHHLKAEKLEAWRRVERLSSRRIVGAEEGTKEAEEKGEGEGEGTAREEEVLRLRAAVYELEGQLRDHQLQRATAAEEHMAVIREQERELLELKLRLEEEADRADAAERRLLLRSEEEEEDHHQLQPEKEGTAEEEEDGWVEELVRPPTPAFDLDSPEVLYLLCQWSGNKAKLQYLRSWLSQVATRRELPPEFPLGVELPRLAREIRDGFVVLVVPLLRAQPWREVVVHSYAHGGGDKWDLRIRVEPRRRR